MPLTSSLSQPLPHVRHLSADRPWFWIAQGWRDLWRAPLASLAYASVFVAIGLALSAWLYVNNSFYLVMPLASGFLLVAPLLAVGFYQLSHRVELGQTPGIGEAFGAWRQNLGPLSAMGAVLLVLFIAWIRISMLIFGLTFTQPVPTWDHFVESVFLSSAGLPFVLSFFGAGALFALTAFALSAVAIPLIFHQGTNVIDAMLISVEAVRSNGPMMLLWAFLIALFTGVGLLTFYLGLLITLPLLGFATWHAYRELIEP